MLVLENVSANIAGIAVLRQISARIGAGTLAAVVGRNGAGKTTLLRTIMGFVPHAEGRVLLGEDDLGRQPPHRRTRLGIGYAPENRALFPTFSVEENLRFPCEVLRLERPRVDERLDEVLTIVPELKPLLGRPGGALSGGQGKMAALGRALMAGTRLVLLDEPFQGLAPVLATQYAESLHRLRLARPNICVLVTESNRSLLKDIPTQTLTLERGALGTEGGPADPPSCTDEGGEQHAKALH